MPGGVNNVKKPNNNRNNNNNKRKRNDDNDEESKLRSMKFIKTKEETPEEIEAWIEERRKKFPTRKKVAEQREATKINLEARIEKKNEKKEKKARIKKNKQNPTESKKICSFFKKGRCAKGDQCKFVHQKKPLPPPPVRPPSLLEKVYFSQFLLHFALFLIFWVSC